MFAKIVFIDRLRLHQKQQRDKAKRDLIQKADEVQEAFKEFVQKVSIIMILGV